MKQIILLSLVLVFFGCSEKSERKVDPLSDKLEQQALDPKPSHSEHWGAIQEFGFHADERTFEELDRYYRMHLSLRDGAELTHDAHNVAFQTLVEQYGLLDQDEEVIAYYIEEINQVNWLIMSAIEPYIQCMEKLQPYWGKDKVREMAKKRHEDNVEEVVKCFTEHDPELVVKYREASKKLLAL